MAGRIADRERVLALLWLVGALLTALTLVLPYMPEVDVPARAAVVVLALATGLALLTVPALPEWALHALVVLGTVTVAFCTSLGVPDVEGVIFLLPIIFASASFAPRLAAAHLALAALAFAIVLVIVPPERSMAPWISFTLVIGVGAVLAVAISLLSAARAQAVAAGQRDRLIAATLQRTLLPESLPSPPGVAVAARYEPAAAEADVGGDFYDAFQLPGGGLAVAIGDVAGKGLPAAAMVGRVRAAVSAYALDEPDPAHVLLRLNRLLSSDPGSARMITLLFAVFEPESGELRYASAGHPPPLVVPVDGAPRYLEPVTGVPAGVLPWARYTGAAHRLSAGDRVLLFTDGLVERRGDGLATGLDRLAVAAGSASDEDPEALLDAALSMLARPQRDDVAVLCLGLTPLSDELRVEVPGRPDALAGLRRMLRRWLDDRCDPDVAERILLACGEVATNAIVHGGTSEQQGFVISGRARKGRIRIEVRDPGRWRSPGREGDEVGRGLAMARALVDHVDVKLDDRGTAVVLEQDARPAPAAAPPSLQRR